MKILIELLLNVLNLIVQFIYLIYDTSQYYMWKQNDDGIWIYCDDELKLKN